MSSGREVALRINPGQLVQKRKTSEAASLAPKKVALDEDTFIDNMGSIIKRDFFPDLPKLEMQLEYLEASEHGDLVRMRELSQRIHTSTRTTPAARDMVTPSASVAGTPLAKGSTQNRSDNSESQSSTQRTNSEQFESPVPSSDKTKQPDSMGLDEYLSKFHSEDDAACSELAEKALKRHQSKYSWLMEQEKTANEQLAIQYPSPNDPQSCVGIALAITEGAESGSEGVEGSEPSKPFDPVPVSKPTSNSEVETWTYKAKNALMYVPEGLELSLQEKMAAANSKNKVIHSNTRLSNRFLAQMNGFAATGETSHQPTGYKVGVDGKVLEEDGDLNVNGFSYVATPDIQPGVEDSPMMTWGTIDGTPLRLDGSSTPLHPGSGPSFKMPKAPRREQLGMKLAGKASKDYTERKKKALEKATSSLLKSSPSIQYALRTPTPHDRLKQLSPAARKLAEKATPGRSVDRALRQGYTPSHTPTFSPMGRGSGKGKTGSSSRPSSTQRSLRGSSSLSGSGPRVSSSTANAASIPSPSLLSDNLLKLNS